MHVSLSLAPTRPPSGISVHAKDSTSLEVSWAPVPVGSLHGTLLGYKVFCVSKKASNVTREIRNETMSCVIDGLEENTEYCVSVLAYTENGDGERSECIPVTTEGGELFPRTLYHSAWLR